MNNADKQYLTLVRDILDHGYYDQNRTGTATYKLPHKMFQFDLSRVSQSVHVGAIIDRPLVSKCALDRAVFFCYDINRNISNR